MKPQMKQQHKEFLMKLGADVATNAVKVGTFVIVGKWSAVLDADAFAAFKETGDILNQEVARKFRHLLEQGGTRDAKDLYEEFRGKQADPQHLLRRKGFID